MRLVRRGAVEVKGRGAMETYWIVEGGEEEEGPGGLTGGHAVYGLRQARAAVLDSRAVSPR